MFSYLFTLPFETDSLGVQATENAKFTFHDSNKLPAKDYHTNWEEVDGIWGTDVQKIQKLPISFTVEAT